MQIRLLHLFASLGAVVGHIVHERHVRLPVGHPSTLVAQAQAKALLRAGSPKCHFVSSREVGVPARGGVHRLYMFSAARETPQLRAFVEATDAAVSHTYSPPNDPSLDDYGPMLAENHAPLLYVTAAVLAAHNDFEAAAPRFEEIIRLFPDSEEALHAKRELVRIAKAEGDKDRARPDGTPDMR